MESGKDDQTKSENEAMKQSNQKEQEDAYGRQRKYQIPEVRGLQLPDTDPGRDENQLAENNPARNKGMDEGPKGKEPQQLRNSSSDRGNSVGESVGTALILPLLPSPEKQQEIIKGDAELNVRAKAKAGTKTKPKPSKRQRLKQNQCHQTSVSASKQG